MHRDSLSRTLWEGTWSSGSITVPGISRYRLVVITDSSGSEMVGVVGDAWLFGIAGWAASGDHSVSSTTFGATVSGDTLTFVAANHLWHSPNSGHSAASTRAITKIEGII